MQPGEIKAELERLADEAAALRARLVVLSEKISAACGLVATIRSTLRAVEGTPAAEPAQEEAHLGGDSQ